MKTKNFIVVFFALAVSLCAQANKPSYLANPIYKQQTELYDVYKIQQADVVMLGDSRTQGAAWNELLNRTNVIGRGIESDILDGYAKRMNYIYKLKPKVCFVSGGVNDLYSGAYTNDQVYQAFINIISDLKAKKVIPVIQAIVCVGRDWGKAWNITPNDNKMRNTDISKINKMLSDYAKKNNIEFLDINPKMQTIDGFLRPELTWDGIHFRAAAYKIWGEEVEKVLNKLKI
jgi:lysophospholipase L1-like esterase